MTEKPKSTGNIQVLEWDEAIRKRPGMFIGRIDFDGLIMMLKNTIRSFYVSGGFDKVKIVLKDSGNVSLLFTGMKGVRFLWEFTPGDVRHILGSDVLNAVSENFTVTLDGGEKEKTVFDYVRARPFQRKKIEEVYAYSSCELISQLDDQIWGGNLVYNMDVFLQEMRSFAFLFKNVQFHVQTLQNDLENSVYYHFKRGLIDSFDRLNPIGTEPYICFGSFNEVITAGEIECAYGFRSYSHDPPYLASFVNYEQTYAHGSHVSAALEGICEAIREYALRRYKLRVIGLTHDRIQSILMLAIHVNLESPLYAGSTKHCLNNPEIEFEVSHVISRNVIDSFEKNQDQAFSVLRDLDVIDYTYANK